MVGISRNIIVDPRYIQKHLPDTPEVKKLLRRGRAVHIFNDLETMERVAQAIIEKGEFTGTFEGMNVMAFSFLSTSVIELTLKMVLQFNCFMER